jgi:hypothetical protein
MYMSSQLLNLKMCTLKTINAHSILVGKLFVDESIIDYDPLSCKTA